MKQLPPLCRLFEVFDIDEGAGIIRWKMRLSPRHRVGDIAGSQRQDGYRIVSLDGVRYRVHRIIFKMANGKEPIDEIDHRFGLKSNSPHNLREATRSQNNRNMPLRIDNRSGFKGVYWHKRQKKWVAMIGFEGRQRHLGQYESKDDAYGAYCAAAQRFHGDFARLP